VEGTSLNSVLVRIWKNKDIIREEAVGKVAAHLCLTVKELKISVEHGRVVTTLNIIIKTKYHILCSEARNLH
jgi:hypothetical protein